MEEKERYINLSDRQVKDTQNNSQGFMSIKSICKTLNQQDKGLSKLRASYQQVKEENHQLIKALNGEVFINYKLPMENAKLKQQLHDLPKKIVEEIRKWGQKHYNWVGDGTGYDGQDYNECIGFNMAIDQLNEILDTILKKYGGEDESE